MNTIIRSLKLLGFLFYALSQYPSLQAQGPVILDTLAYTQISNVTDIQLTQRIRTSGDGSRIIFTGNFKMVYTMKADGSELKQIFDYATFRGGCPCIDVFIDISGDGSTILWTDGANEIFTANFDGSNVKEIASLIPRPSPFADVEPDIRIPPRLTYNGSMVYFFNVAGGYEEAGLYNISSNGAGLTKLFSYKELSENVFGLDGSEYNPNTAFSNYLDISDDGARGIFVTHSQDISKGHTIVFQNSTLSLLRGYGPQHGSRPTGIGQVSISRDGERVALPFRDGSSWIEKIQIMDFSGDNQIELPYTFGTSSTFQLDSAGNNLLATYHISEYGGTDAVPISIINIDSVKIMDLTLIEGNPRLTFREARSPVIDNKGKRIFFFNGIVSGDSLQQMWKLDINPGTLINHPKISNISFSPNYVLFDGSNYTTFTASVAPGVGDILYVNWDTFIRGSYVFRGLRIYGISENLVDDGTFGDVTIGDGIYTRSEVYRDLLEPPAEFTIRFHADAGKYITSIDATPIFLWDSLASSLSNEIQDIPQKFELFQNYPNPFNPSTVIKYQIPKESFVTLKIYDVIGREVKTLVNQKQIPGNYEVTFDASGYSSGVYFYRLYSKSFTSTKKLIYLE